MHQHLYGHCLRLDCPQFFPQIKIVERAKEASTVVWTTSSLSLRLEGKSSLKSTQTRAKTGCLVETSYKTFQPLGTWHLTWHLAADFSTGSLFTPTPLPLFPDNPRTEGEAPTSLMTFPTPHPVGVCTCDLLCSVYLLAFQLGEKKQPFSRSRAAPSLFEKINLTYFKNQFSLELTDYKKPEANSLNF